MVSTENNPKAHTIQVRVVAAHGELYNGTATMVVANAFGGEIGIKPRHTPLIAILKPGQAVIEHADGSEEVFYVSGGVIEVQPHLVTILADDAARAKDLDEAQTQRARENAQRLLADKTAKLDYAKLQAELAQSLAQLRVLRRYKNQVEKRRS
ncbi:MAG: F0F1 ATP synthase subunit epsilon [Gammaproteobacteria bacterium]|nr:F0F1 ATP synthase subunit epsilon [Gammaproteobacteria bacterium]